jgi:uncharacterized protein YoxC
MVVQISAAAAAAAFVVIAVFAVRLFRAAVHSLVRVERTLSVLESQIADWNRQSSTLFHAAQQLAGEVEMRMREVDAFLESVKQTKESMLHAAKAVNLVTGAVEETAVHIRDGMLSRRERIADAAGWAAAGLQLWQQWRRDGSKDAEPQNSKRED